MKFVSLPQVIPIAGDVSTYSNYLPERPDKKNKKGTLKHGWYDADTSYLTGTQLNKLYSQRCRPT